MEKYVDPLTIIILILVSILLILQVISFFSKKDKLPVHELLRKIEDLEKLQETFDKGLKDEMSRIRSEASKNSKELREEVRNSLKDFNDLLISQMTKISGMQKDQLDSFSKQLTELTKINEEKLEKMRDTIENRLKIIQDRNSKELEKMREIVDEKLQSTLEKRLGESFKQVSNQLDLVAKGLGEMRTLATGVGDLKNILSNIKVRGTWGEIQLGALLEEILTSEQYEHNVKIKRNSTVEYAIKLPGKEVNSKLYIPIDSKFPMEDYQRLIAALEIGDQEGIKKSRKQLEDRIKSEAKKIKDKYLSPPLTTNFGILFLPIEGLYLEVLRLPVSDFIQREYNIMITGPTTLAALLNSLQMGFRTLAIEKRSSEVWKLLSAIKTEFGKFGDLLDKTQKKIQVVSNTIEEAARKSRKIESKLKKVEELPKSDAEKLLALDEPLEIDDEPEETTDEN